MFIAVAYEGLKLLRDQLALTKLRMKKKRIRNTTALNAPSQPNAGDSKSSDSTHAPSISDKLKIYFEY